MKVHSRFIKAFGALLIAALLFGAMPAGEVEAQTPIEYDYGKFFADALGASATSTDSYRGTGSWSSNGNTMEFYIDPVAQLGLTGVTVDDVDSVVYRTKDGTAGGVDWGFYIYTVDIPETTTWYGYRLIFEPLYSINYDGDPADTWNTWDSEGSSNQIAFYDYPYSSMGFYYGPTLADLKAGPIDWSTYQSSATATSIDYGAQEIKYFKFGTGSAWSSTFFGLLDAIELTISGTTYIFDLEELVDEVFVDDDVLCDGNLPCYATINEGLDAVAAGGTVNVYPGSYIEGVVIEKPNITIQSTEGASSTFIDTPAGSLTTGVLINGTDLGVITFDGFTVQNFTENGIAQGMASHDGTTVHVKNNVVIPANGYLRNGIQVSGDGSTVIGNTISGAPLTDDWASSGIMVVNASDVTVQNNTIDGGTLGVDIGISIMNYSGTVDNITVQGNNVTKASNAIRISGKDSSKVVSNVTINNNTLTDNNMAINVQTVTLNGVTITSNTLSQSATVGLRFSSSSATVTGITISGNTFSENPQYQVIGHASAVIDPVAVIGVNTFDRAVTTTNWPYEIYGAIQFTIDESSDGDTIKVYPGTYAEQLELNVPNITVQSTGGRDVTILDVPDGTLTTGVKLIADMGTVTFEGFTVKDFTEGGIIQGMSASTSVFHVLNNKVIPAADYLRNGIQVSGDGSTVIGNFVEGAYLTEDWAATAIGVVNASNTLVQNNEVSGAINGIDTGIAVYTWGEFTASGNQVLGNVIYNVDYPLTVESYNNGTTTDVDIHENKVTNYELALLAEPYPDDPYKGLEVSDVDASLNWWGSPCGPIGGIEGEAIIAPWYTDDTMTTTASGQLGEFVFPTDSTTASMNAIIACAAPDSTLTFEGGTYPGGLIVGADKNYLTFELNGATIGEGSPAFTINANYTTINGPGTLDGGGSLDHAIVVADGVIDFTLDTVEILNWADGLHFNGEITDTVIVDNFIHDNTGDAVYFGAQPVDQSGDSFYIQGNMFKDNGGVGVNNAGTTADVNAEYNSWGDYAGPTPDGDGSTNADTNPWTHVEVFIESTNPDVDNWSRQVFVGEQITYEVTADLRQVMGADFVLVFPTNLSVASQTVGSVFDQNYLTITGNEIHFEGWQDTLEGAAVPVVDGQGYVLFTVTFNADTVGRDLPLNFDETTDDFSMSPGYGPSLNIYADELVDATLDVIDRPTLDIDGLEDPFYAGVMSHEITNTTCNPTTGGDWSESPGEPDAIGWIRISDVNLADIASLQFLYDGVWYDFSVQDQYGGTAVYQDGDDVVARFGNYNFGFDIPLQDPQWCDIDKFRVTFIQPGTHDVTVSIYDMMDTNDIYTDDILLVETEPVTITVETGTFEGVGTISMQGRTERLGVPVTLLSDWYADALFYSTSTISDNLRVTTSGGLYTFTTNQPRYLNVTADLEKFIWVDGSSPYEIATIELKGGNAKWVDDNTIDLDDASIVGANYGKLPSETGYNENADVNFDGKVSIQDLALVGGNYDLTSEVAYAAWSPQADETLPELTSVSPAEGPVVVLGANEPFVWIIDAFDDGDNLYELEVDHSMEGLIPEFSVYANEGNPYGTLAEKAEFESNGVYVTYIAADQMWIINFGETITDAFVTNGGITFYVVLKDRNGNQFGTMYGTTPENTFAYTITR